MVLDLEPATWYNVRITAHNSAGFTVAEYEFATLTVTGGICFLFKIKSYLRNSDWNRLQTPNLKKVQK